MSFFPAFSYAQQIKFKCRQFSSITTSYINRKFIPVTSCSVERFSSAARCVNICMRKQMSAVLLEKSAVPRVEQSVLGLKTSLGGNGDST